MAHLLRVDAANSQALGRTTMTSEALTEPVHLEAWLKSHPEVIDPSLMVVTTQFASWESTSDSARERPDLLALSTSGELVVVELKRGGDRMVHLQAITYGALVAGFTRELLAEVHAHWVSKEHGQSISPEEALDRLTQHVESDWSDDLFRLPRLVLVAEHYPAQVLTTVQWLSGVAPDLVVECHEYELFRDGAQLYASFQRVFPVNDLEDRRLRPMLSATTTGVREQLQTNRRRARSVKIIADAEAIPEGSALTLQLGSLVKVDVINTVQAWIDGSPQRALVTWTNDPTRPLVWALEPDATWTPSALRNRIFELAGAPAPSFSAADAWSFDGENLYQIASRLTEVDTE